MTLLHQLYTEAGQSPWIDNLSRDSIRSGRLANMMDEGIRGVTSNPTIFQKAMTASDVYDADFARLLESGSVEQAFWEMATADVTAALEIFHPLYEQSGSSDGFVSLEVSPAAGLRHRGHHKGRPAISTSASPCPTSWSKSRPPSPEYRLFGR